MQAKAFVRQIAAQIFRDFPSKGAVLQYLLQGAWDIENSNDLQDILWGWTPKRCSEPMDLEGPRARVSLEAAKLGLTHSDAFFHKIFFDAAVLSYTNPRYRDAGSVRRTFKFFLSLGMNIEGKDPESGRTPILSIAMMSSSWCEECSVGAQWLQVFLEHGADVTAVDHDGRGPLHLSMAQHRRSQPIYFDRDCLGKFQKVVLLLRAGCSVDAVDVYGKTPGDMAREHMWEDGWTYALAETGMLAKESAEELRTKVSGVIQLSMIVWLCHQADGPKLERSGFDNWFEFYARRLKKEKSALIWQRALRIDDSDVVGGEGASSKNVQSEIVDNTNLSPLSRSQSWSTIPAVSTEVSTNAQQSDTDVIEDIIQTGQHHIWM